MLLLRRAAFRGRVRAVPLGQGQLVSHRRALSTAAPPDKAALTPSARAALESRLLAALATGLDPALVSVSGLTVRPSGHISCFLDFYSGATPGRDAIEAAASDAILSSAPAWAQAAGISVEARVRKPRSFMGAKAPPSLQHVGALVAISSCKGGVGKSTVATNVAFALAELGGRVGLLDADVHGPSLPSLVALPEGTLPLLQKAENKLLQPPLVGGVRLMSYGFIAKGASSGRVPAAVMRGPMVGKVVQQMLAGTEWGELDVLLVDLPPGTGDVQLTLCQTYGLTAALVVTTPQRLARVDVEKGIDMFKELNVPICGLVENMSYFTDPRGETHHPFGKTQLERVASYAGVGAAETTRLPIEEAVSEACDDGVPLVLSRPQSAAARALREAAARLAHAVARVQRPAHGSGGGSGGSGGNGGSGDAQLMFDPKRGIVLRMLSGLDEGRELVLSPESIRRLPGAPPLAPEAGGNPPASPAAATAAAKRVPVSGLSMGTVAEGAEKQTAEGVTEAEDAAAAVIIKWEGGGESVVPLEEFKRLCGQQEEEDDEGKRM